MSRGLPSGPTTSQRTTSSHGTSPCAPLPNIRDRAIDSLRGRNSAAHAESTATGAAAVTRPESGTLDRLLRRRHYPHLYRRLTRFRSRRRTAGATADRPGRAYWAAANGLAGEQRWSAQLQALVAGCAPPPSGGVICSIDCLGNLPCEACNLSRSPPPPPPPLICLRRLEDRYIVWRELSRHVGFGLATSTMRLPRYVASDDQRNRPVCERRSNRPRHAPCSCKSPRYPAPARASKSVPGAEASWERKIRRYCGTATSRSARPESGCAGEGAVRAQALLAGFGCVSSSGIFSRASESGLVIQATADLDAGAPFASS